MRDVNNYANRNREIYVCLWAGKDLKKAEEILLSEAVDVTVPVYENNEQLIHCAARFGLADIIQILQNKGANPNEQTAEGNTPLHILANSDQLNLKAAQVLLNRGAKVNVKNHQHEIPLFAMRGFDRANHNLKKRCEFIELMVRLGADISGASAENIVTELLYLSKNSLIKLMVEKGTSIPRAILLAAKAKNWEMVQYFQQNGTLLLPYAAGILHELCHQPACNESMELADACLKLINPNHFYCDKTPLQIAVDCNATALVELLLQYNANPNLKGGGDEYPLAIATKNENLEIINYLLLCGVHKEAETQSKATIAELAKASKKAAVTELFSMAVNEFKTIRCTRS